MPILSPNVAAQLFLSARCGPSALSDGSVGAELLRFGNHGRRLKRVATHMDHRVTQNTARRSRGARLSVSLMSHTTGEGLQGSVSGNVAGIVIPDNSASISARMDWLSSIIDVLRARTSVTLSSSGVSGTV